MEHEAVSLFPQPLIKVNIDIDGVAKFFDEKIRGNKETFNNSNYGLNMGLRHFHNDENVFDIYSELEPLRKSILNSANYTYQKILNHTSTLKFTNAWFNECDVGSEQVIHNHCNSIISGTLYLRTDENTCIQFFSPFKSTDFVASLVDEPSQENFNRFGYVFHHDVTSINVSDGVCLFWGSHIKHGYPPNKTPGRLSLSFNLIPSVFNCTYKI